MKKTVPALLLACLILAACNQQEAISSGSTQPASSSETSSNISQNDQTPAGVFTWQYDQKQKILHAKIVSFPYAKIVSFPSGTLAKETHVQLGALGDQFDIAAQFKVQYDPPTDSIVFGVNNLGEYTQERVSADLPFDAALYRTDFKGTLPVPVLTGNTAILDTWTLSENASLLLAIDYGYQVPPQLLSYDLSRASAGKHCTPLPLMDHVSGALRSQGINAVYFAGTIEGGTLYSVDPNTCVISEEKWSFPPVDKEGDRVRDPVPSPDHRLLAFPYYLVHAQDGSVEHIDGAPDASGKGSVFSWSDDGQFLVFVDHFYVKAAKTSTAYLYSLKDKSLRMIPIGQNDQAMFIPFSHKVLLSNFTDVYSYKSYEAPSNIIFDIDTWSGKEEAVPVGQFIHSL